MLDLLGNGTACLVWSSPLARRRAPADALHRPDGRAKAAPAGQTRNNLGAETDDCSTRRRRKFYLQDKLAGKPWITRLPFPGACVEKVTVTDKWRNTTFSTTYSYHHGYFDGVEREFRGFGRVEQVDVERFGKFADRQPASPYITDDKTLYQPPVKTVTWFHTGAFLDRERILSQFEQRILPDWFEALPSPNVDSFQENRCRSPTSTRRHSAADEWREALRACKGMLLRQEVYELDVDALSARRTRAGEAVLHRLPQLPHSPPPAAASAIAHAVFLVTESEAITYHYELDLRDTAARSRSAHRAHAEPRQSTNSATCCSRSPLSIHVAADTWTARLPRRRGGSDRRGAERTSPGVHRNPLHRRSRILDRSG